MRSMRDWIRRGALAALACAGAVSSFASAPKPFAIDPESQYLLDVNIRQLRLGDGVRGYPTPQGSCLMLGDMVTVLDLPVIGRDREDTGRRVEQVRGRLSATAYAARHAVGPVEVHRRRWANLTDLGVEQIFVALPDLARASDLEVCAPLLSD